MDQTKRKLANNRITLTEGCFLLTEENCYRIATLEFAEKRPKTATCTTVVTDVKEIPFYHKFKFKKGTYFEKKTARTSGPYNVIKLKIAKNGLSAKKAHFL